MIPNKDQLIKLLSGLSDRHGNLLLDFMQCYGLRCLRDATSEQLQDYLYNHIEERKELTKDD